MDTDLHDAMTKTLYQTCCHDSSQLFTTIESLRTSLETSLGQDLLLDTHAKLQQAVTTGLSYDRISHKLNPSARTHLPVLLHLLQLEFLARM